MKKLATIATSIMTIGMATPAAAQSFWDGFDNNSIRRDLWDVSTQRNGNPFGCTFSTSMIQPDIGGKIALTLRDGACSEIRTKSTYLYGTYQGRLQLSNVPGTVASLFTYDSWHHTPGNPWTEIDIEYLPSFGNVMHTNVIYQSGPTGTYEQWEMDIDLGQFGINPMNAPVHAGFDWTANTIAWYVMDSAGNKRYIRTVSRSDSNCGRNCIPSAKWPSRPAHLFANYWHGNNANGDSANYFPKRYSGASGRAVYDFIQFIDF